MKPARPLLITCLLVSACAAPRWANPQHPGADFAADDVACAKDAERVGRLDQLAPNAANPELQRAAAATLARKQCLAAKGWQATP